MPISRKQFKAGVNPDSLKVLEFLYNNKEVAFTDSEIAQSTRLGLDKLQKLLVGLNQRGYVDIGIVGDMGYFTVSEGFVLRAEAADKPLGQPMPLHPNPAREKPSLDHDDDSTRYIG